MSDILEAMKKTKSRDAAEGRAAYCRIIERAANGASLPEDPIILAEIAGQLGFNESQIKSDIAGLSNLFQMQKNIAGLPPIEEERAAIAAALVKLQAAQADFEKSKLALDEAQYNFNRENGRTQQRSLHQQMVNDAAREVAHLLPAGIAPAPFRN
jgi:hypothetical protein